MGTTNHLHQLARQTERSNRAFERMSPAQKRVTIAEDVIKSLNTGGLKATHMMYFHVKGMDGFIQDNFDVGLKELLPDLPPCQVCAKGGIFTCVVARRNQVTAGHAEHGDMWNSEDLSEELGGIFTPSQLNLIEVEYESFDINTMDLRNRLSNPKDRMIVIMENIIRNGGDFIPDPNFPPPGRQIRRKRVHVVVTQKMIDAAGSVSRGEPDSCPLARGFHAAGLRRWRVGLCTAGPDGIRDDKKWKQPAAVLDFRRTYDQKGAAYVSPIEFDVELP